MSGDRSRAEASIASPPEPPEPEKLRNPADAAETSGNAAKLPYCLVCGYDRVGLAQTMPCPECGSAPDRDASRKVARELAQPLRHAVGLLTLRRGPDGWWCLLPSTMRLRARVQMVTGLTVATICLVAFFGAGAHVRAIVALLPTTIKLQEGMGAAIAQNALLGGVVRGDMGYAQPIGAVPVLMTFPADQPPIVPLLQFVRPSGSPFVVAQIVWLSCIPAAGLLGLRFLFVPLTMRLMRRSLTPTTRVAAAIAADATVAAAAMATAIAVICTAVLLFVMAIVLPVNISAHVIRLTPAIIVAILVGMPPTLLAHAIRNDGARRVFAWPTAAAIMTFVGYLAGIGVAAGVIGITFALASRTIA